MLAEAIVLIPKSANKGTEIQMDVLPLVLCKDCKHGKIHGIDVECVAHEEVGYDPEPWHPLDWFCADGEQKETK